MKKAPYCLLLFATACFSAESSGEDQGFTFSERFAGSYQSLGQVNKLDTSVGYRFNEHFGFAVGVPFYFVRSSTSLNSSGLTSTNGLGNAYLELSLFAHNPAVDYGSTLTLTAPTGDKSRGLSTGRATFDWNNRISRTVARVTPFVDAGISNTIADSPFWIRPFSSLGLNGHFEGGASLRIWRTASVGASAYAIVPTGQQKVFSRVVERELPQPQPGPGRGVGQFKHNRVFETSSTTVGNAGISRDDGYSAWFAARLGRYVDFMAGYTRSARYALDTASIGIGLNLGSLIRHNRL